MSSLSHQRLSFSFQRVALWFLIHCLADHAAPLKSACFDSPPRLNNKQGEKRQVESISFSLFLLCSLSAFRDPDAVFSMPEHNEQIKWHRFAEIVWHILCCYMQLSHFIFFMCVGRCERVHVCFAITMGIYRNAPHGFWTELSLMQKWTTSRQSRATSWQCLSKCFY